ncbi:MAG: hypothetical protein M3494_16615 [Actinomycetota bacterium]|nr:hypothetical protein [Rubrobacter sp.]MDQ3509607.1 hypothetical protein [Actinomycetota bacterium]
MRMWAPALGGEVRYHEDLPSCCRSEARGSDDAFGCVSCGAEWRAVEAEPSEECAFGVVSERDHRGAA